MTFPFLDFYFCAPDILINGFKKCGLVPWNPEAIEFGTSDSTKEKRNDSEKLKRRLKELQDGILFLSRNIDPRKLTQFKISDEWTGDPSDKSFFHFYKHCYNEIIELKGNLKNTENIKEKENREEKENEKDVQQIENNFEDDSVRLISTDNENIAFMDHDNAQAIEITEPQQADSQKNVLANLPIPVNSENIVVQPEKQKTPTKNITDINFSQSNIHCEQNSSEIIPSPFKKILFYPEPKNYKKRKSIKEKLPSVVTSKQWQIYHEKKNKRKDKKKKIKG